MDVKLFILLLCNYLVRVISAAQCNPIFVRWSRVRLNLSPKLTKAESLSDCSSTCAADVNCIGFNHRQGANHLSNDCQIFYDDQKFNVDDHVEADDRFAYYWKYCIDRQHYSEATKKNCKSIYHFDFHIDRFMDMNEIERTIRTDKVEDCLNRCTDEPAFVCRSVSFNRTGRLCSLSAQSQATKPNSLRVNNNPNYRIDYYEHACANGSFTFHHDCRDNGVVISVDSKFPYSGALYALYDFFTCRIEPKDETNFSLFFPFPSYSKNCSDSFSQKESNNVLDVVLSTDGMEPLYFLTDQDTLYQAKCPSSFSSSKPPKATILEKFSDRIESSTPILEIESIGHSSHPTNSEQPGISSTSDIADVTPYPALSSSSEAESSDYIVSFTEIFSSASASSPEFPTLTESIAHTTDSSSSNSSGISPAESASTAFFTPTAEYASGRQVHWTFAPDVELLLNNSSPALNSTSSLIASQILDVSPIIDKNDILQESTINQSEQTYAIALDSSSIGKTTPFSHSSIGEDTVELKATTPLPRLSSTERAEENFVPSTRKFETFVFNQLSSTSSSPPDESIITRKVAVLEPTTNGRIVEQEKRFEVTTPKLDHLIVDQGSSFVKSDVNGTRNVATSIPLIDQKQQHNESASKNLTEKAETPEQQPKEKISFEIFHNNQPVNAVVVASRIVLNFNSTVQLPQRSYLNVHNCQVEPVNSPYASERDPIQIVKNGCQADGVGLVCPPTRADGGEKIEMEALRYTHTSEVLFTCIVRTCGYGQCIEPVCKSVDGCFTLPPNPSLLFQQNLLNNNINFFNNRAFRRRTKRQTGFFPFSRQQQQSSPLFPLVPGFQVPGALQHNLQQQFNSGAFVADRDAVVTRKLIVVNTENELQYFLRTGNVPPRNFNFNGFIYRR